MPMSAAAFFSEESGAEKPQDHSSRNATNSARAASIRSSARSSMLFGDGFFDNMPQVATTFTGGARPIEARGKAQAQAQAQAQTQAQSQQPGSSRVRSRFYGVPASMSGRKNVLNMLRPLATRDMPSEAPSSTTDNDGTASTLSTSTSDSASASASASESESVPAFAAAISINRSKRCRLNSRCSADKEHKHFQQRRVQRQQHTATDTTSSAEQLTPRTMSNQSLSQSHRFGDFSRRAKCRRGYCYQHRLGLVCCRAAGRTLSARTAVEKPPALALVGSADGWPRKSGHLTQCCGHSSLTPRPPLNRQHKVDVAHPAAATAVVKAAVAVMVMPVTRQFTRRKAAAQAPAHDWKVGVRVVCRYGAGLGAHNRRQKPRSHRVIGVHGWFPIRMVQMIAGEPTGKSEKFCLMMRDALKSYLLESHGVEIDDEEITLFPLVGEGRIEDRVELLLSQITDTDEPADKSHPENAPARSESRAASDIISLSATAAASSKGKRKSIAVTTAAKEAVAADSSSNPTGKQSVVIADAFMPERSMRAEILKAADTVFVVTHSQGTPVSAMLLERLIELAIVDTGRQRVGMLAMAGISHGPFPYLKDNLVIRYLESEAARELFELMDPAPIKASATTILHKGVRLICTGSWVDEVVPLYSAILQGVSHPNVYRAVYIDAPHYLDDFLTNLIVFALRLRNMDIYDHDLLIHLSEVVAGSLWGHSGHSTVYGEPAVYKLSIKWLLYSTSSTSISTSESVPSAAMGIAAPRRASVSGAQTHMSYRPFSAADKLNPFFIPWIMRTLWDEPEIRQNDSLRVELQRLVTLFDKWMPETKAGKELKYRLEPVRAAM
ncbi:hypothetical protein BX661DRAFT_177716 [Kickxella alabastrina]|uniref:uncharacterized protein n=1 Tax=Kickxella alabastrina TaxID=61397 RepID=UPI0022203379|nr:uncharacterized protein BX661DRAFT_177716 [Kickxella alabastrina]KAI7833880.1 hypothetical protein BX661DRAFT_177716 [Kickxella alabastrina]